MTRPPSQRGQGRKAKKGRIAQINVRTLDENETAKINQIDPRDRALMLLSQGSKLSATDQEWQFIYDHLPPEACMALLIRGVEEASGIKLNDWLLARRSNERLAELTKDLSPLNYQALMIGLPMFIGADSLDVETYIVDHFGEPVTDDNYKEVGFGFKRWYKENYPTEYHDPEMEMFRFTPPSI